MKRINRDILGELIRVRAERELSEGRICGKEITVLQDGETVFHGTFGTASAGGPPLRENMIYRIASMTKPATAAGVLILADAGKIDLYAPVSDYYPEAARLSVATVENGKIISLKPAKTSIRIIDLLSHTSGIGCSPVLETLKESDARLPFGEAVKRILSCPLSFEPRSWQAYSPTAAFDVAAWIIEIASDMPYAEFLKKKIFDPLGMIDTGFDLSPEQRERTVAIYDRTPDGHGFNSPTVDGCVFEDFLPERTAAGAGLASTAADYSVFAETLRRGGKSPSGVRVLSEEAVKRILSYPLSFEPLTWQAYSPTAAFDVAAGIIEIASDMPYSDFLKKNIFNPLGMADTGFDLSPEQWERTVALYDRGPDGHGFNSPTVDGCVFEDFLPERTAAGAGLASTASDYCIFAETLRRGGISPSGVRILSEESVKLMRTPNVPENIPMGYERWGLGVRVITASRYPHGPGVGCFGWSGAYGTHFWVDPENRITAVLMKNSRYDGGAGNASACGLERDVYDSTEG